MTKRQPTDQERAIRELRKLLRTVPLSEMIDRITGNDFYVADLAQDAEFKAAESEFEAAIKQLLNLSKDPAIPDDKRKAIARAALHADEMHTNQAMQGPEAMFDLLVGFWLKHPTPEFVLQAIGAAIAGGAR
jgi:hypothetical protein